MQRGLKKIMALSRSPIELADKASAIISLRNVLSILFLERISNPIKVRSYSTRWTDHERPDTCQHHKDIFLINDLKQGISPCLGVFPVTFKDKLILIKEEMMRKFYQRE
jgi:hypothetical protein